MELERLAGLGLPPTRLGDRQLLQARTSLALIGSLGVVVVVETLTMVEMAVLAVMVAGAKVATVTSKTLLLGQQILVAVEVVGLESVVVVDQPPLVVKESLL